MNKQWLYLVIGCVGLAAQTGKALAGIPVPDLDDRTLQDKYHVALTEEGLIGALQHQEAVVREFVAIRLSGRGDPAAIPPILAALAVEKNEGVRIAQAMAAAKLGSAEGLNDLKSVCDDKSSGLRLMAAQTMLQIVGREDCLSDLLEVLRPPSDNHYDDWIALSILPGFKQLTPSQLDEIRNLSTVYLKNQAGDLRMAASQLIRVLGGPWAVSQLQAALDAGREEPVRNLIASELHSLRQ